MALPDENRNIEFEGLRTSGLTVLYLFYEILGHRVAILRGGIVTWHISISASVHFRKI